MNLRGHRTLPILGFLHLPCNCCPTACEGMDTRSLLMWTWSLALFNVSLYEVFRVTGVRCFNGWEGSTVTKNEVGSIRMQEDKKLSWHISQEGKRRKKKYSPNTIHYLGRDTGNTTEGKGKMDKQTNKNYNCCLSPFLRGRGYDWVGTHAGLQRP